MHFIGIDLAWSSRNPTGGAVLRGDASGATLLDTRILGSDAEILDYIVAYAGDGPCLVGVDAPLWVPNETGRRPGEAAIGAAFARYQAGAHPANRQRLAQNGVVRGEALVAALAAMHFVHVPEIAVGAAVRQVIEVFPHPAMIALFDLPRTLKYKLKPNRSRECMLSEWVRYQTLLRELTRFDPPLHGHEDFASREIAALRGRALKNYEDQIDALFCAYICLYAFRWGAAHCRMFGTMEGGYIFTPVPVSMREREGSYGDTMTR